MTTRIPLAVASLNQTPLDWNGNRDRIIEAITQARSHGVTILCLPEMCVTGYGCEDAFMGAAFRREALDVLAELLPHTTGLAVTLGLPVEHDGLVYNAVALAVDGVLAGIAAKRFLARDGLHYEPRWFRSWPAGVMSDTEIDGRRVPLGDLVFDLAGVRLGFEICEDAWVAARRGLDFPSRGVDIALNPSASHFAFGKHVVRHDLVMEGALRFGVAYLYANLVGNEAGRIVYDGGSLIAAPSGILAAGPRLHFEPVIVTAASVDLDTLRAERRVPDEPSPLPVVDVLFSPIVDNGEFPAAAIPTNVWAEGEEAKCESFTRAVAIALFDYLRKSRAQGFVVSLSGGADSTAVACLVEAMVNLGVHELGLPRFVSMLPGADRFGPDADERSIIGTLLTCIYQSTRNSSDTTRHAARVVAEAIGATFLEFDVDALVHGYRDIVENAIGRSLSWETDDLALQNIQARVRSPGAWMIANIRSAILLATSNRSEAAVGYATMDGDTSGGISPIAGIDKAFLRRWLQWMEAMGPRGGRPIPELAAVNRLEPTAELRPPEAEQTDEGDLMPYDVLDAIERLAIRDKLGPREILDRLTDELGHDRATMRAWVIRFFRLWCRNQWKRERFAPSFHLDDENLDPKTWCRFPILSGGFQRELARLEQEATASAGEQV